MGKKVGATKRAEAAAKKKKTVAKPKATLNVDWAKSTVTQARLQELENQGMLPSQEVIQWRAPGDEIRPQPREGEVVVFADHVTRGFRPPGSHFFRRLL